MLDRERSCLCVIDFQTRLLPAMTGGDDAVENAIKIIRGARELDVPILASEQYPKGIGPTVESVSDLLEPQEILEKIEFSAASNPDFLKACEKLSRDQAVLVGIEAHVCVLQTALGMLKAGWQVYVVADATASRTASNHALALDRLRDAGVTVVSAEMVLFEWMERAGTEAFKTISALIK